MFIFRIKAGSLKKLKEKKKRTHEKNSKLA